MTNDVKELGRKTLEIGGLTFTVTIFKDHPDYVTMEARTTFAGRQIAARQVLNEFALSVSREPTQILDATETLLINTLTATIKEIAHGK